MPGGEIIYGLNENDTGLYSFNIDRLSGAKRGQVIVTGCVGKVGAVGEEQKSRLFI